MICRKVFCCKRNLRFAVEHMPRISHVGIVVKDMQKALDFYADVFGCRDYRIKRVERPGYKANVAFIPVGDMQIELIQPIEGPWVRRLQRKGEGFTELCFEVENMEEFYDKMKARRVTLVDEDELPMTNRKFDRSKEGIRFAYLPTEAAFGSWIEVMEPYSVDTIGKPGQKEKQS